MMHGFWWRAALLLFTAMALMVVAVLAFTKA
jgi:hypothetical protein